MGKKATRSSGGKAAARSSGGEAAARGTEGAAAAHGSAGEEAAHGTEGETTARGTEAARGSVGKKATRSPGGKAAARSSGGEAAARGTEGAAAARGTVGDGAAHGTEGAAAARGAVGDGAAHGTEGEVAASGAEGAEVEGPGVGASGPPRGPEEAFDALCAGTAPTLVRQAFALTGRRALAEEAVERAFQHAWQRWPEVAVDRDPAGWVRAVAHEYALSPWHRFRPAYRRPDVPPAEEADRALLRVLLSLTPAQRRTLLLYDGVGLDLPETAAETEASTPAAAYRLMNARDAVAEQLPDTAGRPDELHRGLDALGRTERLRLPRPARVRIGSERRARVWTRAAIAFTTLIIGATALTVRTAPTRYEPPQSPGRAISGVPPHMGPGPLSYDEESLRQKLRKEPGNTPARLTPLPR
ncbi:RNA polymerase sigma factor [Streptomyces sp. NPDC017940]|uniref:RNA polymerase sigma factor n=1 Tax=Streptomyces sp. NPDC017940 TaxID=3365017 RepID=UPI003795485F